MLPLAYQLKPNKIIDFIGQEHLMTKDKPIFQLIKNHHIFSILLWGPPGVGKTSLGYLIARYFPEKPLFFLSAVEIGKNDLRKIISQNKKEPPLIFLDEIHRFNKSQQDFLLPFVEKGQIILIGATTENPSFSLNSALLSRLRVFVLKPLDDDNLKKIIIQALNFLQTSIKPDAENFLINYSQGDARKLLNLIDNTFHTHQNLELKALKNSLESLLNYDKKGDQHYNIVSAFIKSMRASQTDASLYYLARMIKSGEDPLFIARRMIIFASEDVGLGQPTALVLANEVFQAVEKIGLPECQINLAFGVSYLCQCKKNRDSYQAYFSALADVENYGQLAIPLFLLNAPTQFMKDLKYGNGYQMYEKNKSFLPTKIATHVYFKKNIV